jgi:hypothetical protein
VVHYPPVCGVGRGAALPRGPFYATALNSKDGLIVIIKQGVIAIPSSGETLAH